MSKAFLWVGFILSIVLLLFGFFIAENAKPLMFIFWFTILFASGYKLFFAAQNYYNVWSSNFSWLPARRRPN